LQDLTPSAPIAVGFAASRYSTISVYTKLIDEREKS